MLEYILVAVGTLAFIILAVAYSQEGGLKIIFGKSELERMSSKKRKKIVEELMSLYIEQYKTLTHCREYTAISTQIGSKQIGEIIAALVHGVPGNRRLGKSVRRDDGDEVTTGDLSDGTEVKTSNRIPSKIDFVVQGKVVQSPISNNTKFKAILIENADIQCPHLFFRTVQFSFSDQAGCTVQRLKLKDSRLIGDEMILNTTGSKLGNGNPHMIIEGNNIYIRLRPDGNETEIGKHCTLKNGQLDEMVESEKSFHWRITKERTQWNLIQKATYNEFERLWKSKPLLVQIYLDPRCRISVAVLRLEPNEEEVENFRNQYSTDGEWDNQMRNVTNGEKTFQPLLFKRNYRTRLENNMFDSVETLGARLIMRGHQTVDNSFKIEFWNPKKGKKISDVESDLIGFGREEDCPDIRFQSVEEDMCELAGVGWDDGELRAHWANKIFQKCGAKYLREMINYADLAGAPRNIQVFGELSEHLTSLVTGLKGTRTASKGADLVERDAAFVASEVKSAVGYANDIFDTEQLPRYDLGDATTRGARSLLSTILSPWKGHRDTNRGHPTRDLRDAKLLSWRRWFPVRWIAEGGESDWRLKCSISTLDEDGMALFHYQVCNYAWNSQFNVHPNPRNRLVLPHLTGDMFVNADGERLLPIQHVCTFEEGKELERANGWAIANQSLPPCLCSWCQTHQYFIWIRYYCFRCGFIVKPTGFQGYNKKHGSEFCNCE